MTNGCEASSNPDAGVSVAVHGVSAAGQNLACLRSPREVSNKDLQSGHSAWGMSRRLTSLVSNAFDQVEVVTFAENVVYL